MAEKRVYVGLGLGVACLLGLVLVSRSSRTTYGSPSQPFSTVTPIVPVKPSDDSVESSSEPEAVQAEPKTEESPIVAKDTRRPPKRRDFPVPEELGSDPGKRRGRVSDSKTWTEFYERAKAAKLEQDMLESMIVDRLSTQLLLTEAQKRTLQDLVTDEQDEFARYIIKLHGGGDAFQKLVSEKQGFWQELLQARREFRLTQSQLYLAHFSAAQLEEINAHLRTDAMTLTVQHGTDSEGKDEVRYLIRGVGLPQQK